MEHSGFFNAQLVNGIPDRRYNADDYRDNMAVIISSGVLRSSNNDLLVSRSGLNVSVAAGRAWIKGGFYENDAVFSFDPVVPPAANSRIDRVMLRFDSTLSNRKISLVYVEGNAALVPVAPSPTRTDTIYDLVLANVTVSAGSSSVTVTDTRADSTLCGWVYSVVGDESFFTSLDAAFNEWFAEKKDTLSSVTLFKRYVYTGTMAIAGTSFVFDIPQFDHETCFLEVYVNGLLEPLSAWSLASNYTTINFTNSIGAGNRITVLCYKSIDGTGIQSVSEEITQLQTQVAALEGVSKFTYKCTGTADNVSLSQIAQALITKTYDASSITTAALNFLTALGGTTYLSGLSDEAQVEISVVGRLGATAAAAGAGTAASPYKWFNLGSTTSAAKRLIFDFSRCEKITIGCAVSTTNVIFYGTDLHIIGANVYAYSNSNGCAITMMLGASNLGRIKAENCFFSINTSGLAYIAENGDFNFCKAVVKSRASNAFCFNVKSAALLQVVGGTYYAYRVSTSYSAAIVYIYSTETDAVALLSNINCPTVAETGFSQQYLAVAGAGGIYINGVCSTMTTSGSAVTVAGQIWKSKR